jgi:hypothetical protein
MKRIVNDSKRHALEVKEGTVTPWMRWWSTVRRTWMLVLV